MNLQAIKIDDTNSVLIHDRDSDMKLWMDLEVRDEDVVCDWNKYIFFTNDPQDMREQKFQEDAINFMYFCDLATDYAEKEGRIYQDDNGKWLEK